MVGAIGICRQRAASLLQVFLEFTLIYRKGGTK
jgi:hypothetical protein